jgi:hypothetical protein
LAALGVDRALEAFHFRPFAVSGHGRMKMSILRGVNGAFARGGVEDALA